MELVSDGLTLIKVERDNFGGGYNATFARGADTTTFKVGEEKARHLTIGQDYDLRLNVTPATERAEEGEPCAP